MCQKMYVWVGKVNEVTYTLTEGGICQCNCLCSPAGYKYHTKSTVMHIFMNNDWIPAKQTFRPLRTSCFGQNQKQTLWQEVRVSTKNACNLTENKQVIQIFVSKFLWNYYFGQCAHFFLSNSTVLARTRKTFVWKRSTIFHLYPWKQEFLVAFHVTESSKTFRPNDGVYTVCFLCFPEAVTLKCWLLFCASSSKGKINEPTVDLQRISFLHIFLGSSIYFVLLKCEH